MSSRPSKRTEPEVMVAWEGRMRSSAIATVLLPDPDSPTRASTLPRERSNETRSTAYVVASRVRYRTERSRTLTIVSFMDQRWPVRREGSAQPLGRSDEMKRPWISTFSGAV